MRVRYAIQIFSNSVVTGLLFYLSKKYNEFEGCESTAKFCKRINNLFDALNRKQPNEGLTPGSSDFKILTDTLEWLNKWKENLKNCTIGNKDESHNHVKVRNVPVFDWHSKLSTPVYWKSQPRQLGEIFWHYPPGWR